MNYLSLATLVEEDEKFLLAIYNRQLSPFCTPIFHFSCKRVLFFES